METNPHEHELRESARLLIRCGLGEEVELEAEFRALVEAQMPGSDAAILARAWWAGARRAWESDADRWPVPADHARWEDALGECRRNDVVVLQGVSSLSEVRASVEDVGRSVRGVLWVTRDAVWHAIDHGVLEVGLRHGNGAPVEDGDPLSSAVVTVLGRAGLTARCVRGGLHVEMRWQRRP